MRLLIIIISIVCVPCLCLGQKYSFHWDIAISGFPEITYQIKSDRPEIGADAYFSLPYGVEWNAHGDTSQSRGFSGTLFYGFAEQNEGYFIEYDHNDFEMYAIGSRTFHDKSFSIGFGLAYSMWSHEEKESSFDVSPFFEFDINQPHEQPSFSAGLFLTFDQIFYSKGI